MPIIATAQEPNKIVGTWKPQSIQAEIDGKILDLYGSNPAGSLIFTANGRFSVILHDPRIPPFASDDRMEASLEEMQSVMPGNLALYGTYTVGPDGQFFGQVVEGSSFPNWNGLQRGREQLALEADGNKMIERFANLPSGPAVTIVWARAE